MGLFAILVYWGSQIDRGNLEKEIIYRQRALGKPVFDDIDFEKYHSIRELIQLNEELSLNRLVFLMKLGVGKKPTISTLGLL